MFRWNSNILHDNNFFSVFNNIKCTTSCCLNFHDFLDFHCCIKFSSDVLFLIMARFNEFRCIQENIKMFTRHELAVKTTTFDNFYLFSILYNLGLVSKSKSKSEEDSKETDERRHKTERWISRGVWKWGQIVR